MIFLRSRSARRKEEEKRKYQHAADYSLYWDDNAKKKYNGEVGNGSR